MSRPLATRAVAVNKIEDARTLSTTTSTTMKGLSSIAYAKRADNEQGARYSANFRKEDGVLFGVAITRSY